jgi:Cd2+/Zn2+-exporting ATPase
MARVEAQVGGMDCSSCAAKIEHVVREMDHVRDVRVDVTLGKMQVELDEGADTDPIYRAVTDLGYSVSTGESVGSRQAVSEQAIWKDRRLGAVVLGAGLIAAATALMHGLEMRTAGIALYLVAIVLGGAYVFRNAWTSVRHLHFDINILMTVAVLGAMAIGEWFEAATVVVLFAFAEWLEGASMTRARRAIRGLMQLAPLVATVKRDGEAVEVPVDDVPTGAIVLVRPGENIPLDGEVVSGTGEVDQSAITGESMPVTRRPGDPVYAGTLNNHGSFEIEVTAPASESTLAHVMRAIEDAQANRSEAERFIEKFAKWYTPAVMVLAAVIAVVPPLAFGGAWETWFYRALVLLVIACPCALVIATPITTVSALARAARDGILVRGGRFLEHLGDLRAIVFDKTGTLTAGEPVVGEVVGFGSYDEAEVLAVAALAEERSEHYVARAIVDAARERGIETAQHRLRRFEAHAGEGVEAVLDLCAEPIEKVETACGGDGCCAHEVDDHDHEHNHEEEHDHDHEEARILVGTRRLLSRFDVDFAALDDDWAALEERGSTVVGVAQNGELVGLIECADRVRDEAAGAIETLRTLGVETIRICTGDNPAAAQSLARAVGVADEDVYASLMPEEKVDILKQLQEETDGAVAMVGDGINDAPALASASVGIAMGAAGTDVALESAHVALMSDDLARLPDAIRLGRRTVSLIRQNIALALGIKLVVLALAAGGVATLWMAIAADMGASLLVIGNGLRLLGPGGSGGSATVSA